MGENVQEQGLEQRYEYYKNILKDLTIMDDVFMRNVFKKSECTEYVLGYGLPIYHVKRKIDEVDESFQDESYIIYVDSGRQDDTELGRLMHDFHCKDGDEMYSEILGRRVNELKKTEEGVDAMCKAMEKIYSEGMTIGERRGEKRGLQKGRREGAVGEKSRIVKNMIARNMPDEDIRALAGCSQELIDGLRG